MKRSADDPKPPVEFTGVRGKPNVEAKAPSIRRHSLLMLGKHAFVRGDRSTVVLPHVDMDADVAAINRGEGLFDAGNRRCWINGRLYGLKSEGNIGQAYPISGDGVVPLDSPEYKTLLIFRKYNGVNERSLREIDLNPEFTADHRDKAIWLWEIREKAKQS